MAWITDAEVEAVYEVTVTDAFIDHVQALAETIIGEQATPSDQLKAVFVDIVYRKWQAKENNPEGLQSEMLGSYQYMQPGAPGLGLTKADKKNLRTAVGRIGLWTQPTTRGQVETPPIEHLEDDDLVELL